MILICLMNVLFPDSPVPEERERGGGREGEREGGRERERERGEGECVLHLSSLCHRDNKSNSVKSFYIHSMLARSYWESHMAVSANGTFGTIKQHSDYSEFGQNHGKQPTTTSPNGQNSNKAQILGSLLSTMFVHGT